MSYTTIIASNFIFFFFFSLFLYFLLFKFNILANLFNIFDTPDKIRKFHKKKTPLLGGVLFIYSLFLSFCYIFLFNTFNSELAVYLKDYKKFFSFFISSFFIFILGVFDDKYNLSANKKLSILFIILLLTLNLDPNLILTNLKFSFFDNNFYLNRFDFFFTILCFLLFINSFNMFDGIDLQSGFYLLQILVILIYFKFLINLIFIFLIFNFLFIFFNYKKKLFLGNGGSLLLGYIISYFFIEAYQSRLIIHADFIFLVMMIPGYDLLRLFLERSFNKRHPFSPDRSHIHHLLLDKVGFKYAFLTIQFIISIGPILNLIFSLSLFLCILVGTFFYFITITYCRYKIN